MADGRNQTAIQLQFETRSAAASRQSLGSLPERTPVERRKSVGRLDSFRSSPKTGSIRLPHCSDSKEMRDRTFHAWPARVDGCMETRWMKSKQKSPVWPYLGILACLFALSITAPRAWNRMA